MSSRHCSDMNNGNSDTFNEFKNSFGDSSIKILWILLKCCKIFSKNPLNTSVNSSISSWEFQTLVFALIVVQKSLSNGVIYFHPIRISLASSLSSKLAYRAEMQLLVIIFYVLRIGVMLNLLAKNDRHREREEKTNHEWYCHV